MPPPPYEAAVGGSAAGAAGVTIVVDLVAEPFMKRAIKTLTGRVEARIKAMVRSMLDGGVEEMIKKATQEAQNQVQKEAEKKLKSQAIKGDLKKAKWRTKAAQFVLTCMTLYSLVAGVLGFMTDTSNILGLISLILASISLLLRIFRVKTGLNKLALLDDLADSAQAMESLPETIGAKNKDWSNASAEDKAAAAVEMQECVAHAALNCFSLSPFWLFKGRSLSICSPLAPRIRHLSRAQERSRDQSRDHGHQGGNGRPRREDACVTRTSRFIVKIPQSPSATNTNKEWIKTKK